MIPKTLVLVIAVSALIGQLLGKEDIRIDLSIEDGSAFIKWSNHTAKEFSYHRNQSTTNGDQFWGYHLYLINEKEEVTKVSFIGETEASVPNFSDLIPEETETTEIELNSWFEHNEKFEMTRPRDGRYIAFMKYDDSEFDGSLGFKSLGTYFTSVATINIKNGKVKN